MTLYESIQEQPDDGKQFVSLIRITVSISPSGGRGILIYFIYVTSIHPWLRSHGTYLKINHLTIHFRSKSAKSNKAVVLPDSPERKTEQA